MNDWALTLLQSTEAARWLAMPELARLLPAAIVVPALAWLGLPLAARLALALAIVMAAASAPVAATCQDWLGCLSSAGPLLALALGAAGSLWTAANTWSWLGETRRGALAVLSGSALGPGVQHLLGLLTAMAFLQSGGVPLLAGAMQVADAPVGLDDLVAHGVDGLGLGLRLASPLLAMNALAEVAGALFGASDVSPHHATWARQLALIAMVALLLEHTVNLGQGAFALGVGILPR